MVLIRTKTGFDRWLNVVTKRVKRESSGALNAECEPLSGVIVVVLITIEYVGSGCESDIQSGRL